MQTIYISFSFSFFQLSSHTYQFHFIFRIFMMLLLHFFASTHTLMILLFITSSSHYYFYHFSSSHLFSIYLLYFHSLRGAREARGESRWQVYMRVVKGAGIAGRREEEVCGARYGGGIYSRMEERENIAAGERRCAYIWRDI